MKEFGVIFGKYLLIVAVGTAPFAAGCSTRKTTTVSTTEVREEPRYSMGTEAYDARPRSEVTTTETKTEEGDNHKGFFGILGDIIALPFRAIGSIL